MNEEEYIVALEKVCAKSDRLVKALASWDMMTKNSVKHIYTQAVVVGIGHLITQLTEEYFELPKGSIVGGLQYKNE